MRLGELAVCNVAKLIFVNFRLNDHPVASKTPVSPSMICNFWLPGTGYNVHIVPVKKLFKESELKSALGFDIAHMAPTEDWWHPTKLVAFCTQLGMVIQRNMEDVGYKLKQESHTYSKAQPAWTAVYYVQKYEQALSKA